MRIAFLTSEFVSEPNSFDGGLSNYLFKVTFELIRFGHEPIVIVSSFENNYFKYKKNNNFQKYQKMKKQNSKYIIN